MDCILSTDQKKKLERSQFFKQVLMSYTNMINAVDDAKTLNNGKKMI